MSATFATSATWCVSWTSVRTGRPVVCLTLCRIRRPASSPGPRKLLRSWRLALSKLALKMMGMSSCCCISTKPVGDREHELFRLDDARSCDEEERLGGAQRRRQRASLHAHVVAASTTPLENPRCGIHLVTYMWSTRSGYNVTVFDTLRQMQVVWKRLKTLSGAALRVQRCSTRATTADAVPPTSEVSPRYEHVRKLVVGLGNPGDKYAKTRHNIGNVVVAHFLDSYVHRVLGKKMTLQHEDNNHGDVARFLLRFQQDVDDPNYTYRSDDLINRSSQRRKDKTLEEGVPHDSVNVALLNPTTYMNRSGVAVKTFMSSHQWRLKKNAMALNRQDELVVVTDDVSLPFGTCRFKGKGGPGGQNGIKDIIKCVGTERFARLKIGIGSPQWFVGGSSGAPAGTAMDRFVLARFNADEQDEMPHLLEYTNELLRLFLHRGLAQASTVANSMDLAAYKNQFKTQKAKKK